MKVKRAGVILGIIASLIIIGTTAFSWGKTIKEKFFDNNNSTQVEQTVEG